MKQCEKLKLLVMILAAGMSLVGCSMTTGSEEISTVVSCSSFQPIYWSKRDTPQTQAQAKEHNAAYVSLCGASK